MTISLAGESAENITVTKKPIIFVREPASEEDARRVQKSLAGNVQFYHGPFSPEMLVYDLQLPNESVDLIIADIGLYEDRDVELLCEFSEAFVGKGENLYFAPRPNDFTRVKTALVFGLAGFSRESLSRLTGFAGPKRLFRRMIGILPESSRQPVEAFGRLVWESTAGGLLGYAPTRNQRRPVSGTALDYETALKQKRALEPKPSLPQSLANMPFEFREWWPSLELTEFYTVNRESEQFAAPDNIHVIVLNKCNLSCGMCSYHSPVYTAGHGSGFFDKYRAMDMAMFEKVAQYAAKNGTTIQFGQLEEPFMHKQFCAFVRRGKELGVRSIHVTTNGTLLDRETADDLIAARVDSVMFSLDAVDPATYREIRGADLQDVEAKIDYFLEKAAGSGISVKVSFILQEQSRSERDEFIQRWKSKGVDEVTFYALSDFDPQTGRPFQPLGGHYDVGEDRYACSAPWTVSVVYPEGEVSLCCKSMVTVGWDGIYELGTLREQSFEEIWHGEPYKTVRRELINGTFDKAVPCADCTAWSTKTVFLSDFDGGYRKTNDIIDTFLFDRKHDQKE